MKKKHFNTLRDSFLTIIDETQKRYDKLRMKDESKESICNTAPYPECNGANGCDTCEHQEKED